MPPDAPAISGLTCEALAVARSGTVFPLLREAIPGLDLQAWLRFARRVTAPPHSSRHRTRQSGIIVARRPPRPMACGLFIWRRDEDLAHGAVLVAEHLVAVDLLDPEPVRAALIQELEALAQRLGCGGIRTMAIKPDTPIAARLLAAGHATDGAAMFKALETAPKPRSPPR